ncbi:MAG: 3-carboxy-cis,cis-muconate cycloisomerase [Ahrensia sp.]|nr:3-carboxy-cis,cis-muconate cycloisomerase [Ahrensia sp.]
MSYTPFNAPLLAGYLGDHEIAGFFSVRADIDAMIRFEIALANAQARVGVIDRSAADAIAAGLADFEPDMVQLAKGVGRDGVVVPDLIAQMRHHIDGPEAVHLHSGTTSQDVIDTALMMRLVRVFGVFNARIEELLSAFSQLDEQFGALSTKTRTRFQPALESTLSQKIQSWQRPLKRLQSDRPKDFPVQLGGPDGTRLTMGDQFEEIAASLADQLGLASPPNHWQTDRWPILSLSSWAMQVTQALGKIGFDIMVLTQDEVASLRLEGGGTSSAMAHKNNPVLAESLVTLSRFAAAQMSAIQHAALHENERSGSAWTVEWMALPPLMVSTGAALRNATRLVKQIAPGRAQ